MFIIERQWPTSFLLIFFLVLSLSDCSAASPNRSPKIIILNSYHPGFQWSDNEVAGVLQELHRYYPSLNPAIEYLDDKRFPAAEHLVLVKDYLKNKYQGHKFDLVIALDNAAFKLALNYRQELFPGVPVIFAGVSGLTPTMLAGKEGFTGIAEVTAIAETLEMALSLHPQTKEIFVVHDYTITGRAVRASIEKIILPFQGRVQFKFAPPATMVELRKQLEALPDDTIIFIPAFATDRVGQSFSQAEAVRLLTEGIKRPAYIVVEDLLGHGPVGGILLGGKEEGRRAGEIALKVLNGVDPARIPVDWKSTARPMFDYRQLARFRIPMSALPLGSIIINRPISFYEVNKALVWWTSGIVIALFLAVLLLSFNMIRRKQAEAALSDEATWRRLLMEQSRDGIVVLDQNGKVYEVNQKYAEMLGYSLEEVQQLYVWDWDAQWTREELLEQIRKVDAAGDHFETRHRRRDGTFFDVEISTNGAVIGGKKLIFCVSRDISQRKQAEEALRESEEKYRGIFEESVAAIYLFDVNRNFVNANQAGLNLLGYSREELLRLSISDVDVDPVVVLPAHQELLSGGRLINYEHQLRRKDGAIITVLNNSMPLTDSHGSIVGMLSTLIDISERKQMEQALALREQEYRTLIENSPDLIVRYDMDMRRIYVNPAWEKASGLSAAEVINKPAAATPRVPQPVVAEYAEKLQHVSETGTPENIEFTWVNALGMKLFLEYVIVPEYDQAGKIVGVLSVGRDLSERQKAEEEKQKLQEQLTQAQKMEAIGTLAGGIAHDFNNILWAIMGFTELTLNLLPEGSDEYRNLRQVLKASERAKDLVNQILAFSRKSIQEKQPLQIALVIKEALKLLRAAIPTTIEINQEIVSPMAMVLADPIQIHQLIMNLCTNSAQAMRVKGDNIQIRLEEKFLDHDRLLGHRDLAPGAYIILTVSDNGPGIAPEIIDKIFDPFFTTKEVGEGTGMGLAVVYGIVKAHGGDITVSGQPGVGVTFTVFLPKIVSLDIASNEEPSLFPKGQGTILVIDDEKTLVDLIKTMLESLGYKVTTSKSSLEALKIFQSQSNTFDLVITDQTMPHMDGMHLSQELRRIRPDIPIVLCTGFSDKVSQESLEAAGIDRLLMKPIKARSLAETVNKLIKKSGHNITNR